MVTSLSRILATTAAVALTAALIPPAAQAATETSLSWTTCPADTPVPAGALPLDRYQCATLEVPLSYRDPNGTKIQLAVGRLPAADQAHKLGTVFYNPGGPGNPGRIPPVLTSDLHQRFDLVGFDPRGVGASTVAHCFTSPDQLAILQRVAAQFPMTPAQAQQQITDALAVDDLCAQNAGPLFGHLSTANVARDLDRLRAAVGSPMLSYYGLSYGTVIGETYANLFPDRVRAIVLDAVDDPVNWTTGYHPADANIPFSVRLGADMGALQALQSFLAACSASSRCAFNTGGDLFAKFNHVLDGLTAGPVTITDPNTGQPATIRYQDVIARTIKYLTNADNSPRLADFLQALSTATTPAPAMAPAATPIATPADSLLGGGATQCADALNPTDPVAWTSIAPITDQRARGFGPYYTYLSLPCVRFPSADPDHYAGPWNRHTANPVLLIGNSQGDPDTPYPGAQRTAKLLGNARLLTLDTFGHGALSHSQCIDDAVDAYFVRGRMPAADTVCEPNHGPFD
ncbi:alpha/beta hydrolase [Kutzneria sp. CA-103260]|uniref:alpha/beta hydrolase n=1 Tax=Kutzneria sp. CA-103260 TaxID=2802641 RepID=UPI001BAE20FE|nr:alpha/beta hydrolase [Kutzneria sp. CA-103260]QUQ66822.1 peptidase/hydrolase [Kutzneria sp. CA-103260]